jgi:hypothetical protein
MPLIDPAIDGLFHDKVTELITDLSDKYVIEAEFEEKSFCPNCVYDVVRKCGSGKFKDPGGTQDFDKVCPVCRNAGKVTTKVRQPITATAQIAEAKQGDVPTPGGDLPEGYARIKALYEDDDLLQKCTVFYIDGVRYNRQGQIKPRGLLSKVVDLVTLKRSD